MEEKYKMVSGKDYKRIFSEAISYLLYKTKTAEPNEAAQLSRELRRWVRMSFNPLIYFRKK